MNMVWWYIQRFETVNKILKYNNRKCFFVWYCLQCIRVAAVSTFDQLLIKCWS